MRDDDDYPSPRGRSRVGLQVVLGSVWVGAVGWGMAGLASHANRAGESGPAPSELAVAISGLGGDADRSTLIVAVHPRCPCTRATASELARLLARSGRVGGVAPRLVLLAYRPREARPGDTGWEDTTTLAAFGAIPGVRRIDDPGGTLARRLGAYTSGHVLIYGPDGRLRFSGGITSGRGHEGSNCGSDAALDALVGWTGAVAESSTFGCPIVPEPVVESVRDCENSGNGAIVEKAGSDRARSIG